MQLDLQDFEADQFSSAHSREVALPDASPWPVLCLTLARAMYYLGFLLLPGIMFWVGLSREDLLHGVYLVLLLVSFLPSSLTLEPAVKSGAVTQRQVRICLLARFEAASH